MTVGRTNANEGIGESIGVEGDGRRLGGDARFPRACAADDEQGLHATTGIDNYREAGLPAMRVRKLRPASNNNNTVSVSCDNNMAAPTMRRKISFSLSTVRFSLRSFALFIASLVFLIILAGWGPLRFLTESDEQFLERQRLYRRMRDLSRIRNERKMRDRYKRSRGKHLMGAGGKAPSTPRQQPGIEKKHEKEAETHTESEQKTRETQVEKGSSLATKQGGSEAELEVYWDDDASLNRVCRIQRGCIARDGAVIVPKWMKAHQDRLESCGLVQIRYESDVGWNATGVYGEFDLFGFVPIRYHIPHFVTDLLPELYAEEVMRPAFSRRNTKHRLCFRENGAPCREGQDRLKIAMYTDDKVVKMKGEDWVPMLVAMLPKRPSLAFPKTIFDGGDTACFRSVVAYSPHSYVRPWRGWYGPKHPLFVRNHISRNSVLKPLDSGGACQVQLTILNRFGWIRRGGYLVGRDITNVDEILGALETVQQKRVKIEVGVEYFENTDFNEQVSIMQKADIILGVHGAGLGNLLFARLDVPFVEVFPFGYYAGPFERLAEALHLKYRFVVSDPDTTNFMECVKKRAEQLERPEVASKGKELWEDAVREWKRGHSRVLHAQEFKTELLTPIKLCARSQRMMLNANETAKLLFELADDICKKRK